MNKIVCASFVMLLLFTMFETYAQRNVAGKALICKRPVLEMPEFDGNLNDWILTHLKYPESDSIKTVLGKMVVGFVVCKNGSVYDVHIMRSSGIARLDTAVLQLVHIMPKWKPGKQDGKLTDFNYGLPIIIDIDR